MELRHKSIKRYSSKNMKNNHYSMLRIVTSLKAQDQIKLRIAGFFFPEVSSLKRLIRFSCSRFLLGLPNQSTSCAPHLSIFLPRLKLQSPFLIVL